MTAPKRSTLADILSQDGPAILDEWLHSLRTSRTRAGHVEVEREARAFSQTFLTAAMSGNTDVHSGAWTDARAVLAGISESQALHGSSPAQTATFVLSLKQPIFAALRRATTDAATLADLTQYWSQQPADGTTPADHALINLCHALFNSAEFLMVD